MAVTAINGAYLDNTGVERIAAAMRQISLGIGAFDGYAADQASLPAASAELAGKTYLSGGDSTPYACDGTAWAAGNIIPVVTGARFFITDGGGVVAEGKFTAKPTYDDFDAPASASGGVCEIKSTITNRALTKAEIDAAMTAAGF